MQDLVESSQKLLVVLDEGKLLSSALVKAESWVSRAHMLMASVSVSRQAVSLVTCSVNREFVDEAEHEEEILCSKEADESSNLLQADLVRLQSLADEGLALRLKLPEITEVQGLFSATNWCLTARHLVESSPTVKEVESHLEDTPTLPVTSPDYTSLQKMLGDAKAWLQAAASFLPGFGIKGSSTEGQLERLIADAEVICGLHAARSF